MKIAKRGRKRYLGLTFVMQSPNDLSDDVLGLVNNWVIYKIDEGRSGASKATSQIPTTASGRSCGVWDPARALVSFTHMRRPVIAAIDPSPAPHGRLKQLGRRSLFVGDERRLP
jgi:uncharacterized protein